MERPYGHKNRIVGVMSGTSLDGLDIALCEFEGSDGNYRYKVLKAETIPYSTEQKNKLSYASRLSAEHYFALNRLFGKFIAEQINRFLQNEEKAHAVASHGHTIFHQPNFGFSSQIGCGATISALTELTTVVDFRSLDVANGGQGAPLVPIGDKLLFSDYDACLNIGGIANISYDKKGERIAYDICFANMALNFLAGKLGKPYDEGGIIAASGKVDEKLLNELKRVLFTADKNSLAREGFEKVLEPVLRSFLIPQEDKMATFCAYAGSEIAKVLNENSLKNTLITGGGAYNRFLIDLIRSQYKGEIVIPDDETIQFKEAIIFAFLGFLRLNQGVNTLRSVTGARSDSSGGAVYFWESKKT